MGFLMWPMRCWVFGKLEMGVCMMWMPGPITRGSREYWHCTIYTWWAETGSFWSLICDKNHEKVITFVCWVEVGCPDWYTGIVQQLSIDFRVETNHLRMILYANSKKVQCFRRADGTSISVKFPAARRVYSCGTIVPEMMRCSTLLLCLTVPHIFTAWLELTTPFYILTFMKNDIHMDSSHFAGASKCSLNLWGSYGFFWTKFWKPLRRACNCRAAVILPGIPSPHDPQPLWRRVWSGLLATSPTKCWLVVFHLHGRLRKPLKGRCNNILRMCFSMSLPFLQQG